MKGYRTKIIDRRDSRKLEVVEFRGIRFLIVGSDYGMEQWQSDRD